MFWGLTLEVGKQYTQIVEEGFHITMATLDPLTIKDKGDSVEDVNAVFILRLRHNKQDYILCTLEPSKQYSQRLDLSFSEGEEVSFFLEGNDEGVLHLTGYLEELQSMPPEEVMLDSDMEEMSSEEEEEEEESSEEEDVPNGVSLRSLTTGEDLEEESEDEWAPNTGRSKKRKRVSVAEKEKKKKRKKSTSSTSTTTSSTGEEEEFSDELDEEDMEELDSEDMDEDGEDDEEEEDESDEDEDEEDSEEVLAEDNMDSVRGVLDFEENDSTGGEGGEEEDSETTHSEPSTPGDTPEVKKRQKHVNFDLKGQAQGHQKQQKKQATATGSSAAENLSGKKKKSQENTDKQQQKSKQQTAEQTKTVNGQTPSPDNSAEQTQTSSQKKKKKRRKKDVPLHPEVTKIQEKMQEGVPCKPVKKTVLTGGVIAVDKVIGKGKMAKTGQKVGLYYQGIFAHNNKHFDSHQSGVPFKFTLGHAEVIKGWDVGIKGMKVGGRRRLEIPPAMAYGSEKIGPIPANSRLIFEVELKSVS